MTRLLTSRKVWLALIFGGMGTAMSVYGIEGYEYAWYMGIAIVIGTAIEDAASKLVVGGR